ncbi:MAG: hypothetical protein Q9184_002872 [Pyrenodesmia sp. 2 TL-2023]
MTETKAERAYQVLRRKKPAVQLRKGKSNGQFNGNEKLKKRIVRREKARNIRRLPDRRQETRRFPELECLLPWILFVVVGILFPPCFHSPETTSNPSAFVPHSPSLASGGLAGPPEYHLESQPQTTQSTTSIPPEPFHRLTPGGMWSAYHAMLSRDASDQGVAPTDSVIDDATGGNAKQQADEASSSYGTVAMVTDADIQAASNLVFALGIQLQRHIAERNHQVERHQNAEQLRKDFREYSKGFIHRFKFPFGHAVKMHSLRFLREKISQIISKIAGIKTYTAGSRPVETPTSSDPSSVSKS